MPDPEKVPDYTTTSFPEDTHHVDLKQADEALLIVERETAPVSLSPDNERRLLRKIDWHLMPMLCCVYGLQFLDKTTLSYASIMGLQTQAHLVGQDYSWLGSIFYLGYLVVEWPANVMMQKLPLGGFTSVNVILWGVVLACTAAADNWSGLMAVRFLLGVFEACITPAFVLCTSQWYKTNEQGARIGIWFSFIGVTQIIGGLIAYGLSKADTAAEFLIAGWKVVFLLTGLLTVVVGAVLMFTMPASPVTARFLTEEEKILAIERIRGNEQGVGNRVWKFYQVKEALLDFKCWLFVLWTLIGAIPNGGLTNFFSIIIQSFGYTSQQSLLYGCPAGAVQIVTLVGFLWLGDRYNQRLLWAAVSESISVVGIALVYGLPTDLKVGRPIGYYLANASSPGYVTILSLVASNSAGWTKKTTVSALVLIAFAVGNLIGPQVFQAKDAPRYTPGLATIVACWSVCVFLLLLVWYINDRENRRRDALRDVPIVKNQEFLDLTDRENLAFRYRT